MTRHECGWKCAFDASHPLATSIAVLRIKAQPEFARNILNSTESTSRSSVVARHDLINVAEGVRSTQALRRRRALQQNSS
jgi:hypothetical protein